LSRDNNRSVIILIFTKQKNDTINGCIMTLGMNYGTIIRYWWTCIPLEDVSSER